MEQIIRDVEEIVNKYKNVERIGTTFDKEEKEVEIDLYDYLRKLGNFEDHVECILSEMDRVIPQRYFFLHKYYYDTYWDGEENVKTYNCTITIKEKRELCDVRNNMDFCNKCGFCGKGDE